MRITCEWDPDTPLYVPRILRSMREICDVMGVGEKTVRDWARRGAPIAVEGLGRKSRYSAEAVRLQKWREGRDA